MLTKVHLNGLLCNILAKLNLRLKKPVDEVDFASESGRFLEVEDIEFFGPTVKDYSELSVPLLADEDRTPFALEYVLA